MLAVLRSMITATAFQILVSNNAPIKAVTDTSVATLEVSVEPDEFRLVLGLSLCNCWCVFQGVLPGAGDDVPTIVITAHYDSYGLAPVSHMRMIKHPLKMRVAVLCRLVWSISPS